jgi:hypothetical protein
MLDASLRFVAGLVMLALAVLAFVFRARMNKRITQTTDTRKQEGPKRSLMVYRPDPKDGPSIGGMIDIGGTVVSSATITAPVSDRPCALWEVSLAEISPASDDSNEGSTTVWVTARSADLIVEYDVRRDIGRDPQTGRPGQILGGPGQVSVPGDQVSIKMPDGGSSGKPIPNLSAFGGSRYRPVDPTRLAGIGVPADLLARLRAAPQGFEVSEAVVGPGGYIHLVQPPGRTHHGPDPDAMFYVYPFGQDDPDTTGAGCLSGCLGIVGVIAVVVGVLVVSAGLVDLVAGP